MELPDQETDTTRRGKAKSETALDEGSPKIWQDVVVELQDAKMVGSVEEARLRWSSLDLSTNDVCGTTAPIFSRRGGVPVGHF